MFARLHFSTLVGLLSLAQGCTAIAGISGYDDDVPDAAGTDSSAADSTPFDSNGNDADTLDSTAGPDVDTGSVDSGTDVSGSDTRVDVAPDGGGDAMGPGTIACGALGSAVGCAYGSQVCCGVGSPGAYSSWTCKATGSCGFLAATCDDPSDCPSGQVCCGTRNSGNAFIDISCKTLAACCPLGATCDPPDLVGLLCDPTRGTLDCVGGRTCQKSDNLQGSFYVCTH